MAVYRRLCTLEDVEVILSAEGLIARADDTQDGTMSASEEKLVNDCISRGSREAAMRLTMRYGDVANFQGGNAPADTPASVRDMVAILAAFWVCKRRNNPVPQSLVDDRRQVFEDLQAIAANQMRLPDIDDGDELPFVTNFHVDGRYRSAKLRRIDATSTRSLPPQDTRQHPEWYPFSTTE